MQSRIARMKEGVQGLRLRSRVTSHGRNERIVAPHALLWSSNLAPIFHGIEMNSRKLKSACAASFQTATLPST